MCNLDWTKPVEIRERDGGVYEAFFIGFNHEGCAVVQKLGREAEYSTHREDGTLKGGTIYQFIRNRGA